MKKTAQEPKVTENPLYHDTWMLLRKYRDVVWSLELSVQQVRRQFQIEYGSSIGTYWKKNMALTAMRHGIVMNTSRIISSYRLKSCPSCCRQIL